MRRPFELHRALFVLPNLFTLSGTFCGFYAITLLANEPSGAQMFRAALAILFAGFFDMVDGRVARLTRTQSSFGTQLDSLSDAVSFGVAPAFLVLRWSLLEWRGLGLFVAFLFAACALLRLARFNVLVAQPKADSTHFVGLPAPVAAGTLVALVLSSRGDEGAWGGPLWVGLMVLGLAGLMVGNVPYRTFKGARIGRKTAAMAIALVLAIFMARLPAATALVALCFSYVGIGVLEALLRLGRGGAAQVEAEDDEDEEDPEPRTV
ncbi:MAG: CDP-diacylglycerol--serine O-phosphatidyltransferase [Myxococcota bacterium]